MTLFYLAAVDVRGSLTESSRKSTEASCSQEQLRENLSRNPLEPLLVKVACDFTDSADLTHRLQSIYRVRACPDRVTISEFLLGLLPPLLTPLVSFPAFLPLSLPALLFLPAFLPPALPLPPSLALTNSLLASSSFLPASLRPFVQPSTHPPTHPSLPFSHLPPRLPHSLPLSLTPSLPLPPSSSLFLPPALAHSFTLLISCSSSHKHFLPQTCD